MATIMSLAFLGTEQKHINITATGDGPFWQKSAKENRPCWHGICQNLSNFATKSWRKLNKNIEKVYKI